MIARLLPCLLLAAVGAAEGTDNTVLDEWIVLLSSSPEGSIVLRQRVNASSV